MSPVCANCGHLRVCHRYGSCEHVKREGWIASRSRFAKETPCECKAWEEPAPVPSEPKPTKGKSK